MSYPVPANPAPRAIRIKPKSALIIGSGPVVIGQAAEFDYAGTQACRALRAEGVRTILVNSNPATIMTDAEVADAVYLEPLTVEAIEQVIAKERPEGLLAGLGGQTGLNLTVALAKAGILEKYNVRLIGTPLEAIEMAEDRELFRDLLTRIGQPYAPSYIVEGDTEEARDTEARIALETIGLPAIVRPAFTLGGTGGGIVETEDAYWERTHSGLRLSPIHQVMIERCLVGWQEIEYEVMRDADDTCIAVCSMENVDPLGVHTGDSIVVAPVQTLPDPVHQRLRSAALAIIRALGVEGGCNVQFALSPDYTDYAVIEVNPRVSRSSALASKATGYPIARVAAQIAAGRRLAEIGLPAIVRPAFTLGGTGGGIVETETAYRERIRAGLRASPIGQVMVERCLVGWQEIEYEVMRDADDTCIAVCSMENVDPLGVHTGDSIVVAPVQTLPDPVHQRLRSAALSIIRALGVEGGCNVQFALSPDYTDYAVIEVNPRVSRSSALASKATGYPIARVAAQIAAGR
ncbi:MAG TPA: hypothetical protein VF344_06300, partial [Candidatus Limnocylindrales bacterium]